MNIFVLDIGYRNNAAAACDKHIVKMILEYAQLLSTSLHELGFETTYRPTHRNHPCAIWTRGSCANFLYVYNLTCEYNLEYLRRFGRLINHKALITIRNDIQRIGWTNVYAALGENFEITTPPSCMPDQYKVFQEDGSQNWSDVVQSYRNYYRAEKARFATYKNTEPPTWMADVLQVQQ